MSEETKELSVPQMLRTTGENTSDFMKRVAEHIDELEKQIFTLQERIVELENAAK